MGNCSQVTQTSEAGKKVRIMFYVLKLIQFPLHFCNTKLKCYFNPKAWFLSYEFPVFWTENLRCLFWLALLPKHSQSCHFYFLCPWMHAWQPFIGLWCPKLLSKSHIWWWWEVSCLKGESKGDGIVLSWYLIFFLHIYHGQNGSQYNTTAISTDNLRNKNYHQSN